MIYAADFIDMAGKISHVNVSKYLSDLGWINIPSRRNHVKIFQIERGAHFFQVDLPVSTELRDYDTAMYRVAETIAGSVGKSVEQVILELLNPLSDILRFRIKDKNSITGSILFESAIDLYDNAKKLLTATAMDIMTPRLYHTGRPDNCVTEFLDNCRCGQTEIGSYVISLICPIANIDNGKCRQLSLFDMEDDAAESITRKVVNKLITSVRKIKESADSGKLDEFVYKNADTQDCISANFLEALSKINIYREDSVLDISVKYAPTIQKNTIDSPVVTIDHLYYPVLDATVNRIKHLKKDETSYIGRISELQASPDAEKRNGGNIKLIFINDNGKKATAVASLSKEDYGVAIEAHREGKTVKIVGTLSGHALKKIECGFFEVLQ
jgi:hypothetical protein